MFSRTWRDKRKTVCHVSDCASRAQLLTVSSRYDLKEKERMCVNLTLHHDHLGALRIFLSHSHQRSRKSTWRAVNGAAAALWWWWHICPFNRYYSWHFPIFRGGKSALYSCVGNIYAPHPHLATLCLVGCTRLTIPLRGPHRNKHSFRFIHRLPNSRRLSLAHVVQNHIWVDPVEPWCLPTAGIENSFLSYHPTFDFVVSRLCEGFLPQGGAFSLCVCVF